VWEHDGVLAAIASAWPELDDDGVPSHDALAALLARAGARWRVAEPRRGESYEHAIADRRIPTRDGSWHDAFNVLAFVVFPHAKAALHGRMAELLRARAPGEQRGREGDALTVLDESTLVLGGAAEDLVALAQARALAPEAALLAIDELVRAGALRVACFGHALLEHRVLGRPLLDAGALAVEIDARDGASALDLGLARAIAARSFTTRSFAPGLPWPHPLVDAWLSRAPRGMLPAMPNAGVPGRGPVRSKAFVLYQGTRTPHRSCGIALAEAFGRPSAAYQSLRRGGVTGEGQCGAIVAGQLLLGELLGDPDPTGKVTPGLREAMTRYLARVHAELDRGDAPTIVCNDMTAPHGEFTGLPRHSFCTEVVAQVAQLVDETLREHGVRIVATPVVLADGSAFDPHA
jgi:Protein of unknown function (DUF3025)